ncbi:hypothetical protein I3400192H8_06890 [Dialister sp. i34-0019-2H8]
MVDWFKAWIAGDNRFKWFNGFDEFKRFNGGWCGAKRRGVLIALRAVVISSVAEKSLWQNAHCLM